MENRKPPTEREVAEWFLKGRLELPPLRIRLKKTKPNYDQDREWDFEVVGQWADEKATFAVEYKSLFTPQAFDTTLQQCLNAQLPPGRLPLIVLPYLRPSQLEELERLGVSGIDLSGNGVVIIPNKFRIFRTGAQNQFTTTAPIKNIYRKNTSMVPRLLTTAPSFPSAGTIRDRVNARNPFVQNGSRPPMRLGTVSKALKALEEDLIIERSGVIQILQGDKLLAQLTENYDPPLKARRKRIKVLSTGLKLQFQVAERVRDMDSPVVATGLSSVGKYAVMAREDTLVLYSPSIDELQERLKGTETDQFPNVELIETDDEPLYFDTRQERGFSWASPLQTYLELMAGDKRDQETASQVKSLLMRTMTSSSS
jgi:hypothetical protein